MSKWEALYPDPSRNGLLIYAMDYGGGKLPANNVIVKIKFSYCC